MLDKPTTLIKKIQRTNRKRYVDHFDMSNMIKERQFGFRKGKNICNKSPKLLLESGRNNQCFPEMEGQTKVNFDFKKKPLKEKANMEAGIRRRTGEYIAIDERLSKGNEDGTILGGRK